MKSFYELLQEMGTDPMYAQQDRDWAALKELVDEWNQFEDQKMSISHSGTGYENPRDSDHFVLYLGGEEITQGDLPQIIQRVRQIRKEMGYY